MKKLLVILGPTATGKTDLALDLAKEFSGELIACDSRQVYRGLDIGTGKEPSEKLKVKSKKFKKYWEIDGVKIWMYDLVDPKRQYTVADYIRDANHVIKDISKRGKLPIIVGGTGLYLKALLEGLPSLAISVDLKLRRSLEKLSKQELQKKLKRISLKRWREMNSSDRENPRRLVRAIELVFSPQRSPYGHLRGGSASNVLKIGLTAPRPVLYDRIDTRVMSRLDQGMIEEAQSLHRTGLSFKRMKELGLEYGVLAEYLQGSLSRQQLIDKLKTKIHQYAKRQLTWFKKEKEINWFDVSSKNYAQKVEKMIEDWYNESHVNKKS